MKCSVFPSILSANFANLEADIRLLELAGADFLHIDVMDGLFVPNITIGACVARDIAKTTKLPLDCHLMIQNPEKYIEDFAKAGASIITVHAEACVHLDRTIELIKSFGVKAGVSLVPTTHESTLEYIIEKLDLVLVMTVNPGFGGQKFLPNQLKKISAIAKMIKQTGKQITLQVDGGINAETAKLCRASGASAFVSGNYLFEDRSKIAEKIALLQSL